MMLILTGASVLEHPVEFISYDIDIPVGDSQPFRQWNISYPVPDKELHCLALNVYFEARGEDPEGQFAVAEVVMHRVNHFNYPNTICGVVKQGVYSEWSKEMPIKHKCNFSWFCDRLPDDPIDGQAFGAAMYVATTILKDPKYMLEIEYALYYHADYVEPYWADDLQLVGHIGNHLFY